jgi:hypothetical protein
MEFVNRLRPEHLRAFWYFPSKMNFTLIGTFGGLLWATAPSREEGEFYKVRLKEYRWTLSVSSQKAKFLGYAVKMLDASRNMLRNLAEKPSFGSGGLVNSAGFPTMMVQQQKVQGTGASASRRLGTGAEGEGNAEDVSMLEETPPLTRNTSLSNMSASIFSGFSGDVDSYVAMASSSRARVQSSVTLSTSSERADDGSPTPMED